MELVRAGMADINRLVQVRLDFLRSFRAVDPAVEDTLREESRAYFVRHLESGGLLALFAMDDEQLLGTAFLSVYERPPSDRIPYARFGRLTNVYTYPEHRGKGCARALVKELLHLAKQDGLASVELSASDEGIALYRKLGFNLTDGTNMWRAL